MKSRGAVSLPSHLSAMMVDSVCQVSGVMMKV